LAEERAVFGFNAEEEDRAIVCDDCWNILMFNFIKACAGRA
jgi:hypothetical protein